MRVLCLGATGRLGQMVQRAWQADRRLSPVWHGRRSCTGAQVRCFDILAEPAALKQAVRSADVTLCLAGVTPSSGAALSLNTTLALAVLEASEARPLLMASSASVYGRVAGLCREEDKPTPVAPYGRSKLEMENAVRARGGRVTCLRIGNVAGADQILGRVERGEAISLDRFADGRTPVRSYIGPTTLARQLADLALAAGSGTKLPDVLNLAAPGAVEMGAILDAVPYPWQPRPAPDDAIAEVVLDTHRLSGFITLDPASGQASRLVAEWRADREKAHLDP